MRFINAYQGVAERPNVTMRTSYINTIPHILIICREDIEIGEEFLLDYGVEYTKTYLTPIHERTNEVRIVEDISWAELAGDHSSDDEPE